MIRKAVHSFLVVSILATGLLAPLHAQIPYPSLSGAAPDQDANPSTSQPAVEVKQQRKEVADRLRVAQRQLEVQKENKNAPENAEATEKLSREVGNLKQLEVVLSQQQAAEERRAEAEKQERDLEAGLKELRAKGPSEPKPYSFLIMDQLRDELFAEAARKEAIQATVEATTEARSRAKTSLEEKERKRRKAKEALDTNKDENAKPHLVAALAEAELDSRLAGELVKLRDIEFVTEELAQKTYELRLTYLSEKSDWLAKDSTFTKADLEQQLFELEKRERDLKQSLQVAETTAQFLEKQWLESRGRLDAEADRPPALVEEVESRRVARLAQQQRITVFGQRLARLEDRRQAWNRRSKISRDEVSKEDRQKWYEETKLQLDQLNRERRLQAIRLDDVRKDQATLEARLEGDPQQIANMAPWLKSQQRTLRQLLSLRERNIISIDTSLRVHDKLLAELRASEPATTWKDRWAYTSDSIVQAWNYELASIDDRPITVKKIVTGVVLLFVGYLLSRLISRLFGRRFLPRLGVHSSAASAFQSLLFYTLLVLFAVFALKIVNVPLTAFTLLGGALALGVGFGSQNVINNFISGLILLAERPIKVGDLVQIDSLFGNVEEIGARSTRIKTGANHEIIVPNSSFLESNVVNWTLSDDRIRTVVKVGVIYGSPTHEVTRLLTKAVQDHGMVLPKPDPILLFTDFGDNSLNFEIHFWIRMRSVMERLRIESDIRYKIDQLFCEAGLVIAFPQRDVHLDSVKPLEIRLLTDATTESVVPPVTPSSKIA